MSPADATSAALERVMARFGAMLRSIGKRRGLSTADLDELEQEVRLRLWRALGEHEKIAGVKASYVYRSAISAAVDLIRRRRGRQEEPITFEDSGSSVPVTHSGPETEMDRQELALRIDREIGRLAPPRDVVVRLHLSGYDRFEIASMLGWTEPKVRNLIYRGLTDLREALQHEGIGQSRSV